MSFAEKHTVEVTTATGGGVTGYTPAVTGRIQAIIYTRPTGAPFASTADIAVTTEITKQNLWTESNVNASENNYPVIAANVNTGAASSLTEKPMYAVNERIKIAILQGGNTKQGTFTVIIA